MSGPRPISEFITSNIARNYYALDTAMVQAYRNGNKEFAENTARSLLEHADLPLLIRARACMMIACCDSEDFLEMAREAVRIAELGYSRCSNPGELEEQLVEDCRSVLRQAVSAAQEDSEEEEANEDRQEEEEANTDEQKAEEADGA